MKTISTPNRVSFGRDARHSSSNAAKPPAQPKSSGIGKWLARMTLIAILGLLVWGGFATLGWIRNLGRISAGQAGQTAVPTLAPARQSNPERIIALCEDFSARVAMHGELPDRSPLGWGLLGQSQESNSIAMDQLVETLAMEIGASKVLGSIRTLREVEQAIGVQTTLATSTSPVVVAQAVAEGQKLQAHAIELKSYVRQELNKEGFNFTDNEIAALCASPNAEDVASMITAFGVLKQISAKMEQRLRIAPSQESAQRYYGGYTVLLLALDNIQKKGMSNIESIYIPKALEIKREAEATSEEAARMLSSGGLNNSERRALLMNMDSCQTTIGIANSTERKLQRNLDILSTANNRLALTIKTAKNSHMTALLQKEMIRLEARQSEEIAQIEALVIPELVGVNFADPTRPEVTPPREPQG